MSRKEIRLELPVPPSLNRKYISRNFIVSKEWRDFHKYCEQLLPLLKLEPFEGDVEVEITWFRARKAGDIDSKLKALLDALAPYAYADDKQVARLVVERLDTDKKRPRVEVAIRGLS